MRWDVITGEYPPQPGGVGDYTRLLARGLAGTGDEVHVWAPPCPDDGDSPDDSVHVHRLPDHFGRRSRALIAEAVDPLPRPAKLLVQYVPHAFGWKAMNVPFCAWLCRRRGPVWVLFHEVAHPLRLRQLWKHSFLALVQRLMAGLLLRGAEKVFIATPAWEPILQRLSRRRRSFIWLPVPSNMPAHVDARAIADVRARLAPDAGQALLGHFGTYGANIATLLLRVLPPLLAADSRRRGVLLGRGSDRFLQTLRELHPECGPALSATGPLEPEQVAAHLAACDLLVQPYPDGITTRRASAMAGLALARPVVSCAGELTESVWKETGAVSLAPSPEEMIVHAESLLANETERSALALRAAAVYAERFSLAKTLTVLRSEHPDSVTS